MGDIFENIYKKFFLRDVLSIFLCGLLINLVILNTLKQDVFDVLQNNNLLRSLFFNNKMELNVLGYLFLIGFSYLFGLIINHFRDRIQFLLLYKIKLNGFLRPNIDDYNEKLIEFYYKLGQISQTDNEIERMIMMFQFCGNFGFAIFLSVLIWWLSLWVTIQEYLPYILFGIVIITSLWFSGIKFIEHIDIINRINRIDTIIKSKEK